MIKAIIIDIEGTTSSLSFVKDVLFPYARAKLPAFVEAHQQDAQLQVLLDDAAKIMGGEPDIQTLITQFVNWIDEDKKITPLKSLQGLIWEAGYQQGDFKGHVYADAVEALRAWKAQGLALYVYSSGSVQAQKLLFAHTEYGDLTPLFSGYFDTHVGGKREQLSYQRIADEIALPADSLLFLSDITEELDAAKACGYQTVCLNRDGAALLQSAHPQANQFTINYADMLSH